MAATVSGRRLTEAHRLAQTRLSAAIVSRVRPLWRLIDVEDIAGTLPTWVDAVTAQIIPQHATSVALAGRYFRAFRAAEFGAPPISSLDLPPLNREALRTSLIVVGPARIRKAIARSEPVERASQIAAAETARAAARHAVDGGRQTILRAISSDRASLGFARATSGNPCAFCALIASRGAVYGSEAGAGFAAHDGCNCTPEPVFDRSQPPPPGTSRYADLYEDAARGSSDPLTAFRRAYEGRD